MLKKVLEEKFDVNNEKTKIHVYINRKVFYQIVKDNNQTALNQLTLRSRRMSHRWKEG